MRQTRFASIPVVVVAAAASAALAADSVDLQLRGKDRVAGTLRPVTDTECYVCDLPRGAQLSVALKGAGKPFPTVGLALRLDGLDVGGAPIVTNSKGATIKSYEVGASGRYTVCVVGSGEVDGDYSASVSWKPRSSWVGTGGPLDPAATDTYTFGAPRGAFVTIDLVAPQGSLFDGQLVSITGPAGFDPQAVAGTHAVIPDCPVTGDYSVKFSNDGVAAGEWTMRVKLKLPKVQRGKVDVRDRALAGAFGLDHTVYGRLVDEEGGIVTVGDESGGALAGSSVSVPADALGSPTVITISATTTVYPDDGSHPAGPAVEFGPEGTVFAQDATLTLPYDPAYFPGGTETLEVYVRDAEGNITLVPGPYTVDEVNHLVSFPVSHFSSYQAAASGPRPLVGDFYVAELSHEAFSGFEGKFGFGLHGLTASDKYTGVSLNNARIAWHDNGLEGSDAYLETSSQSQQFVVTIPDDATVILDDPQKPGEGATFVRGTSDDVMVGKGQAMVALRRAPQSPTVSSIAGRWHLFHLQAGGGSQNSGGGLPSGQISLYGETGEVTFRPDGTLGFSDFRVLEAATGFPAGTWSYSVGDPPPSGIGWYVSDGIVFIAPPEGESPTFQLYAALDGDVLLGQPYSYSQTESSKADLFIFVRASARQALSAFAGVYSVAGKDITFEDRSNPPGQGMTFQDQTITSTVSAAGATSIDGFADITSHDATGNPTFVPAVQLSGDTGRLSLADDGIFTLPGGLRGAVSPNGAFAVQVRFAKGDFSMFFSTPALPTDGR
jgi:hypothetical protein